MSVADLIIKLAGGAGGGGIVVAAVAAVRGLAEVRDRRAEAAKKVAEAGKTGKETEVIDHEQWFREAEINYNRLNHQFEACRDELKGAKDSHHEDMEALRREHREQIGQLRQEHDRQMVRLKREVGEVRDALVASLDDIDTVLPYVQGIPDEKLREIRTANRVRRNAAKFWGGAP